MALVAYSKHLVHQQCKEGDRNESIREARQDREAQSAPLVWVRSCVRVSGVEARQQAQTWCNERDQASFPLAEATSDDPEDETRAP